MKTTLTNPNFPLALKKRILDIMHEKKCTPISAEQFLLCELLKKAKDR